MFKQKFPKLQNILDILNTIDNNVLDQSDFEDITNILDEYNLIDSNTEWTLFNINQEYIIDDQLIIGHRLLTQTIQLILEYKKPQECKFPQYSIYTWNTDNEFLQCLQESYNQQSLKNIQEYLDKYNILDILINKQTQLPYTCFSEDNNMAKGIWITDTIRIFQNQLRHTASETEQSNIIQQIIEFYQSSFIQNYIQDILQDKVKYLDFYTQNSTQTMAGIPHIMRIDELTQTITGQKNWHNNARLESHGLALQLLINCNNSLPEYYELLKQKTIKELIDFFDKINYSEALSCGNWEEIILDSPMLNDMVQVYKAMLSCSNSNTISLNTAKEFIKQCITEQYENIARQEDASSAFAILDCPQVFENISDDIQYKYNFLNKLNSTLVGNYGIRRYNQFQYTYNNNLYNSIDSYLNINSHILLDSRTGKINLSKFTTTTNKTGADHSSNQEYLNRIQDSTEATTAEWFMTATLARAYIKLWTNIKLNQVHQELLPNIQATINKLLNISLARITPIKQYIKSNGEYSEYIGIPEAIQYININNNILPNIGLNTPLSWANSELYALLKEYQEVLDCE